jgi:hypothetical protein
MSATDQRISLDQMTTYELRDYRQDLETALSMETLPPIYLPRDELQRRLDAVLAEQEMRRRIAGANS